MKLKQLLILGALLLSGSASAAIVDGVRQAPATPTALMKLGLVMAMRLLTVL